MGNESAVFAHATAGCENLFLQALTDFLVLKTTFCSQTGSCLHVVTTDTFCRLHDGGSKFPKLGECAHFHYDFTELGPVQVRGAQEVTR